MLQLQNERNVDEASMTDIDTDASASAASAATTATAAPFSFGPPGHAGSNGKVTGKRRRDDGDAADSELGLAHPTKSPRVSTSATTTAAASRTKFSALSNVARLLRLKAQATVVKALRRSVRGLRARLDAQDAKRSRVLSEEEAEILTPALRRTLVAAIKAQRARKFELPDQARFIENFAKAVANGSFNLGSLAFDVMATQLRPATLKSGNMSGMRYAIANVCCD